MNQTAGEVDTRERGGLGAKANLFKNVKEPLFEPVSYTHLTLPTIYSV